NGDTEIYQNHSDISYLDSWDSPLSPLGGDPDGQVLYLDDPISSDEKEKFNMLKSFYEQNEDGAT
ncbi:hypothetical protein ACFLZS_00005, partial [Patescibacteria group bacterium]